MKHVLIICTIGILILICRCGKADFHPDVDDSQELLFLPFTGEAELDIGEMAGIQISGQETLGAGEVFGVQFIERKASVGDYWTAWFTIREEEQESFRSFFGKSKRPELIVKVMDEYFSASVFDTRKTAVDHMGNQVVVNDSINGILIGLFQKSN